MWNLVGDRLAREPAARRQVAINSPREPILPFQGPRAGARPLKLELDVSLYASPSEFLFPSTSIIHLDNSWAAENCNPRPTKGIPKL